MDGFGDIFGSMGNQLGGIKPVGDLPFSRQPAAGWGTIGGPPTGGKSQSMGAPGSFQQPQQIPNAAGAAGARGAQSGANQPGTQVAKDPLGFNQKTRAQTFGVMPIPTRQGVSAGRLQKIGDSGSSVGQDMTQPMMGDLQQSKPQKLGFMDTLAQIESSGGTNTRNLLSPSHVGKYQMSPSAFKRFGGGGDINNEAHQAAAAQNMVNYNRQSLGTLLGREPTDAETYLSYQQGLHGAWQLLSNPDKPAGSLVKPEHIHANGGDPRAPARQFINTLTQKWNETSGGMEGQ